MKLSDNPHIRCDCIECGYYSNNYTNHCVVLRDLTYTGCTRDINCECFKSREEAIKMEEVIRKRLGHHSKENIDESIRELKKLKKEREAFQNEQAESN